MTKINFTRPECTPTPYFNPKVGDIIYNSEISEDTRWYAIVLKVLNYGVYDLFILSGNFIDRARYGFAIEKSNGWRVAKEMEVKLKL